jgi:hypothetical protein
MAAVTETASGEVLEMSGMHGSSEAKISTAL